MLRLTPWISTRKNHAPDRQPKHGRRAARLAVACMDALESRQMLTTFTGGGVDVTTFPGHTIPLTNSFRFYDSQKKIQRVTIGGNTTAEFVFVKPTGGFGGGGITGPIPPPGPTPPADYIGSDLFAIYVTQADLDSFITIEEIGVDPTTGLTNPLPFTGAVTLRSARIIGATTSAREGTGTSYIGLRTIQPTGSPLTNLDLVPITSITLTAVQPNIPLAVGDTLYAGLSTAPGVDLGKFFVGGTVTGKVNLGGSMDTFYAGDLFTGWGGDDGTIPHSFQVAGDLRDLVTRGDLGSFGTLTSDFQLEIAGRIGQIRSFEGNVTGGILVSNGGASTTIGRYQSELEAKGSYPYDLADLTQTRTFAKGFINDSRFGGLEKFSYNDSFATAQYLGTINSDDFGANSIQLRGDLGSFSTTGDSIDYYGVGLRAGQTITVKLQSRTDIDTADYAGDAPPTTTTSQLNMGVFDPDGRLILTDYSDQDYSRFQGRAFSFTADRPGVYRFAASYAGDQTFTGSSFGRAETYELTIGGAGDIALGGVVAGSASPLGGATVDGTISFPSLALANPGPDYIQDILGLTVQNGDLGAIAAGTTILARTLSVYRDPTDATSFETRDVPNISVVLGNLNSIEAGSAEIVIDVPAGDVGLIRTLVGSLYINLDTTTTVIPSTAGTALEINDPIFHYPITTDFHPIGKNIQLMDAKVQYIAELLVNGRIGTIRAGTMGKIDPLDPLEPSPPPSILSVNYDKTADGDGTIDLIDVTGDLGSFIFGGPQITTGPRGNVRFIHVGGDLYRDSFFGIGLPEVAVYSPGVAAELNDDSGAIVRLVPGANANKDPVTGAPPPLTSLSVLTYGIRGSGGVVIVDVASTGSLSVLTKSISGRGSAEFGHISVNGAGTAVLLSALTGRLVPDTGPTASPLFFSATGDARIDVLNLDGGQFSQIRNSTVGDLVNVTAASIVSIEANRLGSATSNTPAALNPLGLRMGAGEVYPFDQQHVGIVAGDIINLRSRGSLGNIIVDPASAGGGTGSVDNVVADSDRKHPKTITADTIEGIIAPIYATGDVRDIDIGQGITPSGNGNAARSGLFVTGTISLVHGQQYANIRGNILSSTGIKKITLDGGSIINADIAVAADFAEFREYIFIRTVPNYTGTIDKPIYLLGAITVQGVKGKAKGNGGIIGTTFWAGSLDTIKVVRGFGLMNSSFITPGNGIMKGIDVDGYGIREVRIAAGAKIGQVIARGRGTPTSTASFNTDTRISETSAFDDYFDTAPSRLTDLHSMLVGTSADTPIVDGVTEAGVIDGTQLIGSRDLGDLTCWQLRGYTPQQLADDPLLNNTKVSFSNSIGSVNILDNVHDVLFVTGAINIFKAGSFNAVNFTAAGTVGRFTLTGYLSADSTVSAVGPDGIIRYLSVGGDLDGLVSAEVKVSKFRLGGAYNGSVLSAGVRIQPT